ncbi:MAG: hypothetical protein K2G85_04390 [Muribaculaceae bacterium]|nr:hypothetical protein [Muribaculaceae bacterium]
MSWIREDRANRANKASKANKAYWNEWGLNSATASEATLSPTQRANATVVADGDL